MGDGPWIHVLVVDDSILDRKIVEQLLLKHGGFKVTTAECAENAMEVLGLKLGEQKTESPAINESKVDIILTDYCMPGLNGFDLLKAVKENEILKSVPVVLMSSENDLQRISSCRDSGAEDFILKPLTPNNIQQLRGYVKSSVAVVPKVGMKRKASIDSVTESRGSERRTRLAGVAVA